jgi:transcription elongation factor GreB
LKELWRRRREEVVPALQAAAAEGDRSENAEYTYRKRQLAEIDRRVRYLSKRLDEIEVVQRRPADTDRVFFGATVTLETPGTGDVVYRIVGSDEIDAGKGYISVDSPLARSIIGRRTGDSVEVELPDGRQLFTIRRIAY